MPTRGRVAPKLGRAPRLGRVAPIRQTNCSKKNILPTRFVTALKKDYLCTCLRIRETGENPVQSRCCMFFFTPIAIVAIA